MPILDELTYGDELKLSPAKRGSDVSIRRIKMLLFFEKQWSLLTSDEKLNIGAEAIAYKAKQASKVSSRKVRPKFDLGPNRKWGFIPYYGSSPLKTGPKGQSTIWGDEHRDSIKDIILTLVERTKNGELDEALEKAVSDRLLKSKAATSSVDAPKTSKPGEKH